MKCRGCGATLAPNKAPGRRREWCSDRCRKWTLYAEPCADCGALFGGRANGHAGCVARYCPACAQRHSVEAMKRYGDAVRAEAGALWREGRPTREIAAVLEWKSARSVRAYVGRQRALGFEEEFPLRHAVTDAGRKRQAEGAKAARAAESRVAA